MADVLSQNEIDALLQALGSGEVDVEEIKEEESAKKVKKYDFHNPQKIAKDQLRTIEIIHENFSRILQTFLTGYLRTPVEVSILTVEQYAYSEFSNAISNPAFLSIINFEPLSGQILMEISTNVVYVIIDRLLGGDGNEDQAIRTFTEIELSLLEGMVKRIMNIIKEAWSNVIDLDPTLEMIEVNSQFAQIVPPNETIALVTLNINVGSAEGMINMCIPYIVIEPILDKLSTKYWFSTGRNDISNREEKLLKERILQTAVPIRAELGSSKIKVKDILNLQKGDVIKLNVKRKDPIKIKIGSHVKFLGEPGKVNSNMAVKVLNVVKDGEMRK